MSSTAPKFPSSGTGSTTDPSTTDTETIKTVPQDATNGRDDDDDHADDEATLLTSMIQSLPTQLTYSNTKSSQFYTLAKHDLQVGNFELALSKIEQGITTLLEMLTKSSSASSFLSSCDADGELHESLAPLYYLYGTTLLYSVEESRDNPEDGVVTAGSGGGGDSAEDIQIAWENLESARSILTRMIDVDDRVVASQSKAAKTAISSEGTNALTTGVSSDDDCRMDLAQIYSRLGDLSRHNGHYEAAVRDYNLCRTQRKQCLTGDAVYDRRVADVEYSLGMSCLLLASEGEKNLQNAEGGSEPAPTTTTSSPAAAVASKQEQPGDESSANTAPSESKVTLSLDEVQTLRDDSIRHYLECGRIFGGMIGLLCGQDPAAMGDIAEGHLSVDYRELKCPPVPDSATTTTSNAASQPPSSSLTAETSLAFQTIRKRVRDLTPTSPDDVDDVAQIEDLREMLDEIQETIDTCETDREGLGVVNAMRKRAEEEAARGGEEKDGGEEEEEGGGTTTIGFGSGSKVGEMVGVGFGCGGVGTGGLLGLGLNGVAKGTNGGGTKVVNSVPMMVIKKKKKKIAVVDSTIVDGGDTKRVRLE